MWIVWNKNNLINANAFISIGLSGSVIYLRESREAKPLELTFEDEDRAKRAFNYLLEGVRGKAPVVHL